MDKECNKEVQVGIVWYRRAGLALLVGGSFLMVRMEID